MIIVEFCNKCGTREEFEIIGMEESDSAYKMVTLRCCKCGNVIRKNMMI